MWLHCFSYNHMNGNHTEYSCFTYNTFIIIICLEKRNNRLKLKYLHLFRFIIRYKQSKKYKICTHRHALRTSSRNRMHFELEFRIQTTSGFDLEGKEMYACECTCITWIAINANFCVAVL